MKGINLEAYRPLMDVKDIVKLWGPRILIEEMGEEEAIRTIGEEKVVRTIGEQRLREILDRMAREKDERGSGSRA